MKHNKERRVFLRRVAGALGAAALTGALAGAETSGARRKPDILFLFADDMPFNHGGALGCSEVHTPNLDRLVRRGVRFTNCYSQGGWHGAICVASRTMLLTGRYLWDAKKAEEEMHAGRREPLWPEYLEQVGYHTYMSGKWHVRCNPKDVFRTVGQVRPGMPPDISAQYDRPKEGVEDPFDSSNPGLGGFFKGGRHWSEVLADEGVEFIQDAANREAPFFMYLAVNAPHDPRQAPRAYLDQYALRDITVPDNFLPEYPYKDVVGCGPDLRDERLAPFPRTEQAIRTHRREYYAAISHMDAQIGRILDALEAAGGMENTVIIFTADNGLAVGQHGLMGKQNMFEHSMKVPLVIAGPGLPAGEHRDALVYMQDIVPTTCELAGAVTPAHVSYRSLLPLISDAELPGYEAIYGAYMDVQRMVRVADHKLVYYPAINRFLLFNLVADPWERNNLADDPAAASVLEAMQEALKRAQTQQGDLLTSLP